MTLRDTNLLNIINLNNSVKSSIKDNNLSELIKLIYKMRISMGEMVFNLYKLQLRINEQLLNNKTSDMSNEYYYMNMYENIIDSIKQLINRYENNYLHKKDGESIEYDFSNYKPKQNDLKDININISIKDFLNDLKIIGKSPELLSPEKFKDELVYLNKDESHIDLFEEPEEPEELVESNQNYTIEDLFDDSNNNQDNIIEDIFDNNDLDNKTLENQNTDNNIQFERPPLIDSPETINMLLYDDDNQINNDLQNIWGNLESNYGNTNNKFTSVNCSSNPDLAQHLNYPGNISIIKINGNLIDHFNKDINYDNLSQFINQQPNLSVYQEKEKQIFNDSKKIILTLYCSKTCSYCVDFMDTWSELQKNTQNKPIHLEEISCDDNLDKCNHLDGTPTLSLYNETTDETIEYNGSRDLNSITNFIDEYISHNLNKTYSSEQSGYTSDTEEDVNNLIIEQQQHQQHQQQSMNDFLNTLLKSSQPSNEPPLMMTDLNIKTDKQESVYNQTYLILYYHTDCKYSIDFLDNWKSFKIMYNNKYEPIQYIECRCDSNNNKEEFKARYQLQTFPTVELIKNNIRYRFNSDQRTDDNLIQFITAPDAGINQQIRQNGGSKQIKIMNFYADWCPHCTSFKPIWNSVKNNLKSNNIIFEEYNADINHNEIEQYNIKSFPTVLIETGDELVKYSDSRTVESLTSFIKHFK